MKKNQKISIFRGRLEQNTYTKPKRSHLHLKISERIIFQYSNSIKVNWPAHLCFRRNFHLVLTIMYQNYCKYNHLTHTLNVNKVLVKKLQVIHS